MPEIFKSNTLNSPEAKETLSKMLNNGSIGIVPVDTVFGIVGRAFDPVVNEKIGLIKDNRKTPFSIIFGNAKSFMDQFKDLNPISDRIINALTPGPVTFLLPAGKNIPDGYGYDSKGIGVRITSNEVTQALCESSNSAI